MEDARAAETEKIPPADVYFRLHVELRFRVMLECLESLIPDIPPRGTYFALVIEDSSTLLSQHRPFGSSNGEVGLHPNRDDLISKIFAYRTGVLLLNTESNRNQNEDSATLTADDVSSHYRNVLEEYNGLQPRDGRFKERHKYGQFDLAPFKNTFLSWLEVNRQLRIDTLFLTRWMAQETEVTHQLFRQAFAESQRWEDRLLKAVDLAFLGPNGNGIRMINKSVLEFRCYQDLCAHFERKLAFWSVRKEMALQRYYIFFNTLKDLSVGPMPGIPLLRTIMATGDNPIVDADNKDQAALLPQEPYNQPMNSGPRPEILECHPMDQGPPIVFQVTKRLYTWSSIPEDVPWDESGRVINTAPDATEPLHPPRLIRPVGLPRRLPSPLANNVGPPPRHTAAPATHTAPPFQPVTAPVTVQEPFPPGVSYGRFGPPNHPPPTASTHGAPRPIEFPPQPPVPPAPAREPLTFSPFNISLGPLPPAPIRRPQPPPPYHPLMGPGSTSEAPPSSIFTGNARHAVALPSTEPGQRLPPPWAFDGGPGAVRVPPPGLYNGTVNGTMGPPPVPPTRPASSAGETRRRLHPPGEPIHIRRAAARGRRGQGAS